MILASSGGVGPILISTFVSPISRIVKSHGITYHQYADNIHLYMEVRSLDSTQIEVLSKHVSALTLWFLDKWLQLNSKTSEASILFTWPGLSEQDPVISGYNVLVKDGVKISGQTELLFQQSDSRSYPVQDIPGTSHDGTVSFGLSYIPLLPCIGSVTG